MNESRLTWMADFREKLKNSITVKLVVIGAILLILLIPTLMVHELVSSRKGLQAEAEAEVAGKWGMPQTFCGPFLVIPGRETITRSLGDGRKIEEKKEFRMVVLPDDLKIESKLIPEIRSRGIFKITLYRAELTVKGRFEPLDATKFALEPGQELFLNRATLVFGLTDIKGVSQVELKYRDGVRRLVQGAPENSLAKTGLNAPEFPLDGGDFTLTMLCNGSTGIGFFPLGRRTEAKIESSWPSPSFEGSFLPREREVSDTGFKAEYLIGELNREYPGIWRDGKHEINDSTFGVKLFTPVNIYQLTFRAVKYAALVIVAILTSLLFAETLSRVWVHPAQYFVAGLMMVLFYVLLLSFSEYCSFAVAYWIASAMVVGSISGYCLGIFRRFGAAGTLAAVLSAVFGILYVLLQLEDFALMVGAMTLFVTLLALMFLTRNLNKIRTEKDSGERDA